MSELSIIQKTYDLVKWYVPILNRLPRSHKFTLGDRTIAQQNNIFIANFAIETETTAGDVAEG